MLADVPTFVAWPAGAAVACELPLCWVTDPAMIGGHVEPDGSYVLLVLQLEVDQDGRATVSLDGTVTLESIPLRPATLVLRLWYADAGTLRLQSNGGSRWVPIQCNDQLVDLLQAWLAPDTAGKKES